MWFLSNGKIDCNLYEPQIVSLGCLAHSERGLVGTTSLLPFIPKGSEMLSCVKKQVDQPLEIQDDFSWAQL